MSFIVLDPTSNGEKEAEFDLALRPETLDGKTLGVIDNGKLHSDVVLQYVVERLQREYRIREIKWVKKASPSHPVPPEQFERLKECHLVLAGVGD